MSRKIDRFLIDALTLINTTGVVNDADIANSNTMGFHVEFNHTSSAGVVVIETASNASYAGVWAILQTVTWSAIDKSHYTSVTTPIRALRARISTAVADGAVSVWLVGNN